MCAEGESLMLLLYNGERATLSIYGECGGLRGLRKAVVTVSVSAVRGSGDGLPVNILARVCLQIPRLYI